MSTENGKSKGKTGVDLERLSQADAAWLIDRKASWLREHANLMRRNAGGTYNARELVKAIAVGSDLVHLSDEHYEALHGLTYGLLSDRYEDSMPGLQRVLDEVVAAHGQIGARTAIGGLVFSIIDDYLRSFFGVYCSANGNRDSRTAQPPSRRRDFETRVHPG